MRKNVFFLTVTLAACSAAAVAETVVPASDSRIVWVGRTLTGGGEVSFDWSSVYARIAFQGNSLSLKASDTHRDYFNVWIDKEMSAEPDKVMSISGDTLVQLVSPADFSLSKAAKNPHMVIIQKRTEGEQGRAVFKEFEASGAILQAGGLSQRMIEFVGDSYTCGYGSENSIATQRYRPETQNPSKTYAAVISRYFGADFVTIAHSGQGISRNYDDGDRTQHMPSRYSQTFDLDRSVKWQPQGGFRPAITVIYLGTNDFSTERQPMRGPFKRDYMSLLSQIKAFWGENHPILCVSSKADPILFEYVRETVEDCGLRNVFYTGFFNGVHLDTNAELGADWHPNYKAHVKLAYALIPYISTITGWEMEAKPVE